MGLMHPNFNPGHSIQDAFVGSKSTMNQDTLTPPDRGIPRSPRRAVTDPFHVADASLDHRPSKRSRGKAAPLAKSLRYTTTPRRGQSFDQPVGRIIPMVRGSLPVTNRLSRQLPTAIATKYQQEQSPQAHVGSTINTHDSYDGVSRVSHLRGLHRLYPSPTSEVPKPTSRHKVRLTSGDAAWVSDRPDLVLYPRITRTTTGDSSPVDGFAAEEQSGYGTVLSRSEVISLLSTSMEAGEPPWDPFLDTEATTTSLVPSQTLPRSFLTETLSSPLASSHYTISQDHTAGEDQRKSSLLASFSKRGYGNFY